jgi:hypothetical protein
MIDVDGCVNNTLLGINQRSFNQEDNYVIGYDSDCNKEYFNFNELFGNFAESNYVACEFIIKEDGEVCIFHFFFFLTIYNYFLKISLIHQNIQSNYPPSSHAAYPTQVRLVLVRKKHTAT